MFPNCGNKHFQSTKLKCVYSEYVFDSHDKVKKFKIV